MKYSLAYFHKETDFLETYIEEHKPSEVVALSLLTGFSHLYSLTSLENVDRLPFTRCWEIFKLFQKTFGEDWFNEHLEDIADHLIKAP